MLPFLPMKLINSKLGNARDQLNFQRAVDERLGRRAGSDNLICPICACDDFELLATAQSKNNWFERIRGGPGKIII